MQGLAMQIPSKSVRLSSEPRSTTCEAWASYVRRRFPQNCLAMCQREWDLSEGRARGLVWSQATQRTIEQILAHPRGGVRVLLAVEAIRWGLEIHELLERYADEERAAIAHERTRLEDEERRIAAVERLAAERRRAGREHGRPVLVEPGFAARSARPAAADLGGAPTVARLHGPGGDTALGIDDRT